MGCARRDHRTDPLALGLPFWLAANLTFAPWWVLEQDEEWSIAERRYFSVESTKQLLAPAPPPAARQILASIT